MEAEVERVLVGLVWAILEAYSEDFQLTPLHVALLMLQVQT
jgi:hypothetical protein